MKIPSTVRRYSGFMASVGSARAAGTALAAATLLFLLRALGTETYGKWAFVLVAVGFVNLAANPGITSFAQQRVAARRERAAGLAANLFSLRLSLAVVVSTFLVVYAVRLESDPVVRRLLLFYGVPSVLLASLASDYALNAMERFHSRSVQQILSQGLYAGAVFLWVRGPEDVYVVAGAALGSSLTASLFGWGRLWSAGFRIRWRVDLVAWKEMLTVGLFYGVSSLMSQLYTRAGHLVVRWWAGDSALGLYAAIVRLVEMIFSFLGIAYGLLMPRIALYSQDRAMLRRIARYAVVVMAFVGLPLAIGGSVAAASLIPWALGPEYADAVPLFQVMAWYFITNSLSTFFSGTVVYGLGHARDYFRSTVAGAVAGLVLYLVLVPAVGVLGAGIAYVGAQVAVGGYAYWTVRRVMSPVWRSPALPIAAGAGVLMAVAVAEGSRDGMHPLVLVGAGALSYLSTVWLLGGRRLLRRLLADFARE